MKTCAITGYRPSRFKWKDNEGDAGCQMLKGRIREQIILLLRNGFRRFWLGGALGVDLWAGEILLELKQRPEYSEVELCMAIPFTGYDGDWTVEERRRMAALRRGCVRTVVVGTQDKPAQSYRRRNYYMVDRADLLLAVYDSRRTIRSGTGMTVSYARKKELPVLIICPDIAAVPPRDKEGQGAVPE